MEFSIMLKKFAYIIISLRQIIHCRIKPDPWVFETSLEYSLTWMACV